LAELGTPFQVTSNATHASELGIGLKTGLPLVTRRERIVGRLSDGFGVDFDKAM
jgi:hypothetical protein